MKNKLFKTISCIMCFILAFSFSFVLAEGEGFEEEAVIKNISSAILNALMWFAYAIALGVILFAGIKYMMSPANEKANLKGMLPKYLIGIFAITCCFTIAKLVANVAGNNQAEDIINVGKDFGIVFEGDEGGGAHSHEYIETKETDARGDIWYVYTCSCGEKTKRRACVDGHEWESIDAEIGDHGEETKITYTCGVCGYVYVEVPDYIEHCTDGGEHDIDYNKDDEHENYGGKIRYTHTCKKCGENITVDYDCVLYGGQHTFMDGQGVPTDKVGKNFGCALYKYECSNGCGAITYMDADGRIDEPAG